MSTSTKDKIKHSFLHILETKPLSKITVKEIVSESYVNRNSFYYHYQDIPSLLEEILTDEADYLISLVPDQTSLKDSIISVISNIEEKKNVVYNIWHSYNREQYESHLLNICSYSATKYVNTVQKRMGFTASEADTLIDLLRCEFTGQILEWIHHNMSYDLVEHTTAICVQFQSIIEKKYNV